MLQLARIKPKPREHVAFVVDPYLNVIGIIGVTPGDAQVVAGGPVSPDDERVLPRIKFAVLTFRPEDGDPRGSSVLRPAYEPWWRKRQVTQEYLAYLSQFAGPSLWATTAEDAQSGPVTDSYGLPVTDTDPDPIPPEEAPPIELPSPQAGLKDALVDFRNATVLVAPHGTEIHTIEMQGDGEPFLLGLTQCDQQITKAILTQTLATEEGQHQARAAASVHQDVLDTLVKQGKRAVVRMLQADILKPWVALNYGSQAADELVPVPSLGTTEQRDMAPMMTAVAALERAGYLDKAQRPAIDAKLGLPVRELLPYDQPPLPLAPASPAPAPAAPSPAPASPTPAPAGPAQGGS